MPTTWKQFFFSRSLSQNTTVPNFEPAILTFFDLEIPFEPFFFFDLSKSRSTIQRVVPFFSKVISTLSIYAEFKSIKKNNITLRMFQLYYQALIQGLALVNENIFFWRLINYMHDKLQDKKQSSNPDSNHNFLKQKKDFTYREDEK